MAKNKTADLVIIGNGVAGNSAALSARQTRPDMSICILGCEEHPEYSPGILPNYLAGSVEREQVFIRTKEDYQANKIQLYLGQLVEAIDPDKAVVYTDSTRIKYSQLILATGSQAIIPPVSGSSLPGNFVLKTLFDTDQIIQYPAQSAVVIGSGAIGLEAALALKKRGYEEVSLIEKEKWVLPKSLDEDTARMVEHMLEQEGVQVYTAETVESVQGKEKVQGVVTDQREIPCQIIVWAVGVRPNVSLATSMGITLGETGGIKVDPYMCTNIPQVYACGDCVESTDLFSGQQVLNLLWDAAYRQGKIAGINCAGGRIQYPGSFGVLLTYVGEAPVLSIGLTAADLGNQDYEIWERTGHHSYGRLLIKQDRLVGVQMLGTLEGAGWILSQLHTRNLISMEAQNPSLAMMLGSQAMFKGFLKNFTRQNH